MLLPFLKQSKWPRLGKPEQAKLINGSPSDKLEEQCFSELTEACASKNIQKFRSALEALVMSLFEESDVA